MGEVTDGEPNRERQARRDPALDLFLSARDCLRALSAGATFARLLASGFLIASCFAWPYLPVLGRPFAAVFAATLGTLMGRPIDRRRRRS